MARLSVIVPNFNRAGLIGETLSNLLSQSRAPDELIVVDDGSTDDSCDVIAGFGPAVRLLRQANAGPGAARNRGLGESTGEFIQFFDSDDLCSLDKLEAQERALAASDAPFAYGPWLQASLDEGIARYSEPPLQQRGLPARRSALAWYLRGWVTVFQCCLLRRQAIERSGGFREDLMVAEDLELLFRILNTAEQPVHVPEALVLYRLHAGLQLSRGGIAPEKHAHDWLSLVTSVSTALDGAAGLSPAAGDYWRQRQWQAQAEAFRLGVGPEPRSPATCSRLAWTARSVAARVRGGVSRRLGRSSFSAEFGAAPLTPDQSRQLRAIGYSPVRVGHAALEPARPQEP